MCYWVVQLWCVRTRTFKYKRILRGRNHQNAKKKVRFYWQFRSRVPVFKGRPASGKSAVLHLQIRVFNIAWKPFWYTATYQARKHAIAAETKSCSKKVTSYFTKETITKECKHIAAKGELFASHTIKHNLSFRSTDCTSSVIRKLKGGKVLMWSNKMWIHCSKCLGPFCHTTDF
jgi:hypothetical protein